MRELLARLAVVTLVIAPLAAGCERSAEPKRAGAREESTRALALRVRLELLEKLGVDGLRVRVEAEGGRVRLAGEVKKRATAELAEEVAERVEGVASVSNDIRVAGGGAGGNQVDQLLSETERELADAALETRVHLALIDRLGSDGFRIGTDAASGVLTLEFPRGMERGRRREATAVAERVPGVDRVISLEKD